MSISDHKHMPEPVRRIEVFSAPSVSEKLQPLFARSRSTIPQLGSIDARQMFGQSPAVHLTLAGRSAAADLPRHCRDARDANTGGAQLY